MGAMELEENTVQIRDDFDPDKILESGQCFRPRKQAEGWYRFVSGRQLLYLRPLRSGTYTVRCEPGAWETFWHGYFDLGRSYAAMRGKLDSRDDFLQRAMEYGRGIRVLRQDEWEMLVSFIISQRKSIPAIRRAVELLSERFGERLGSDSEGPVYAFPTAEALCCAGEQALQECGLGYRTRYVLHAAQQAAEGTLDLKKLASLPDEALFARLMELDGVGKKVANCVCLFGYGRVGRVPVDVWIERLIRDEFAGQDPFPQFGLEAGIVQQYLFFIKEAWDKNRGAAGRSVGLSAKQKRQRLPLFEENRCLLIILLPALTVPDLLHPGEKGRCQNSRSAHPDWADGSAAFSCPHTAGVPKAASCPDTYNGRRPCCSCPVNAPPFSGSC